MKEIQKFSGEGAQPPPTFLGAFGARPPVPHFRWIGQSPRPCKILDPPLLVACVIDSIETSPTTKAGF